MSLSDIQKIQQQNIESHLSQLIELLRQTEEKTDLTQVPTAREEYRVEAVRLKNQIEKYKKDLVDLTAEIKQGDKQQPHHEPVKNYRVSVDESLLDAEADLVFRDEVVSVLDLMGYEIENAFISGATPASFLAVQEGDFEPTRAIFQCVHGIIDEATVAAFSSIFNLNKDSLRVTLGRIVTNTYISPRAVQLAAQFRIGLLTFEDLLDKVIDVTRYLKSKCREYREHNKLFHQYVEVKYLRKGKGKFKDNQAYPKEFLVAESPDGSSFEAKGELTPYIEQWSENRGISQICLLGDYGTGKTSFATHYFYKKASAYLENPIKNRIPLLISLNRYFKSADIEEMVTGFLANECNVRKNANFNNFLNIAERGKLLVILDGFDEMAKQVDVNVRRHNFSQIARLLVGNNKVILSGRPNYFLTLDEINEILGQDTQKTSAYDAALYKMASGERPRYGVLNIALFDRWQIQEFLEKQSAYLREQGIEDWRELEKTIYDTYNLEELARTPVLLEIIIKTIPEIQGKVTDINAADLYKIYTDFWLNRDYDRGEVRWLITRTEKELFVLDLAWQMLKSDNLNPEIHFSKLSENVRTFFGLEKANEIEYFSSDIRFCSYLVHSESDGSYKFIHKSFMEYFCARYIYNALIMEHDLSKVLINKEIPEEIFFFLCQIIKVEDIKVIEDITRNERDDASKEYLMHLTTNLLEKAVALYERRGNREEVGRYVEALTKYSNEFNFSNAKLKSLVLQGDMHEVAHRFDLAQEFYAEALSLTKVLEDRSSECQLLIKLGRAAQRQGMYNESQRLYEEALALSKNLKDESVESQILMQLGNVVRDQGLYKDARGFYQQALSKSKTLDDRIGQKQVLINIGRLTVAQGSYAESLDIFQSALALSRELGDRLGESQILTEMGDVVRKIDNYSEAENFYREALVISLELNDMNSAGGILHSLGTINLEKRDYNQATQLLRQALRIGEELGDKQSSGLRLEELGNLELRRGNYNDAEQFFRKELEVSQSLGDRRLIGRSYLNLAIAFSQLHNFEEARTYYEAAYTEFKNLNDLTSQAQVLLNLGRLYVASGDLLKAEDSYHKALRINISRRDFVGEGRVLEQLGELKERQHRLHEASELYDQSLNIWLKLNRRQSQGELYAKLGRLALKLNERQRAIDLFSKHISLAEKIGVAPDENVVREHRNLTYIRNVSGFNWSAPVTDPDGFFGRKQELREIYLSVVEGQHILIVGDRRMGKTSLLTQLRKMFESPFISVYVDLEVAFGRAEAILNEILRRVVSALVPAELISAKSWNNFSLTYASDFDKALDSILREAKEKLPTIKFVLILDEAEAIFQAGAQVADVLRATLQENRDVVAVLAGTRRVLGHEGTSVTSPLLNTFKVLFLKPLTEEETTFLITETAKQVGVQLTPDALARIYELSGGMPLECQMIGREVLRTAQDKGETKIDIQDVDDVIPDLLDTAAHIFKYKWDDLSKKEKSVLRLIARRKKIRDENQHTLDTLKKLHLIVELNGEYGFREKLFEKWLRYNQIITI